MRTVSNKQDQTRQKVLDYLQNHSQVKYFDSHGDGLLSSWAFASKNKILVINVSKKQVCFVVMLLESNEENYLFECEYNLFDLKLKTFSSSLSYLIKTLD